MAQAVVGLGNPGPEYRSTRHNVGQRVVEHLARTIAVSFRREGRAMVGRGQWRGEEVFLVKPLCYMNESGPPVAAALHHLGLGPGDIVLVYDDIDLPLGTVRVRLKGSHGGHKGVRSIIETLGTSDVRRVKVGIGRPGRKEDVSDHVLTPFDRDELPAVETAVDEAQSCVLALIEAAAAPTS